MGELVIKWDGVEPLVFYPTGSKEFKIKVKLDKSVKGTEYYTKCDYNTDTYKEAANR